MAYLEVVDLPRDHSEQHHSLQYRPPLHPGVGGFCRITVRLLTNQDILLLIFHGGQAMRH